MKVVNKQFKMPKTDNISTDYVLNYFKGQNIIRWAIVDITEKFYIVDSAVITNEFQL